MELLSSAFEVEALPCSREVQLSSSLVTLFLPQYKRKELIGETAEFWKQLSCQQRHIKLTWDNYNKHTKMWFTETQQKLLSDDKQEACLFEMVPGQPAKG